MTEIKLHLLSYVLESNAPAAVLERKNMSSHAWLEALKKYRQLFEDPQARHKLKIPYTKIAEELVPLTFRGAIKKLLKETEGLATSAVQVNWWRELAPGSAQGEYVTDRRVIGWIEDFAINLVLDEVEYQEDAQEIASVLLTMKNGRKSADNRIFTAG